jgi:predicted acyltransferase
MNVLQAVPKIRIRSMDVMRGFTLFLMLFVNDLFIPGVPKWLVHSEADEDGMGLADWVFPGFLFMVGMAVPYAVAAREKIGSSTTVIFVHILIRTLSLLLIGVLILNGSRVDPQLTGMSHLLWLGLLYVFVFLIWNHYPKGMHYQSIYKGLRVVGIMGIIYLLYIFKASDGKGLEVGWWGILGLIGWGYFAAASIFLLSKGRIFVVICGWLMFFLLNILAHTELKIELTGIGRYLHVLLSGNIPSIVLAGTVVGMLMRRYAATPGVLLRILFLLATIWLAMGFVLRFWFILSKIHGTPSWALVCCGVSVLLLIPLYYFIDVKGYQRGMRVFEEAGKNSLTTYLAPDLIYFVCWGFHLPLFFYKQSGHMGLAIAGSLLWAFAMLWYAILLKKRSIYLKL